MRFAFNNHKLGACGREVRVCNHTSTTAATMATGNINPRRGRLSISNVLAWPQMGLTAIGSLAHHPDGTDCQFVILSFRNLPVFFAKAEIRQRCFEPRRLDMAQKRATRVNNTTRFSLARVPLKSQVIHLRTQPSLSFLPSQHLSNGPSDNARRVQR